MAQRDPVWWMNVAWSRLHLCTWRAPGRPPPTRLGLAALRAGLGLRLLLRVCPAGRCLAEGRPSLRCEEAQMPPPTPPFLKSLFFWPGTFWLQFPIVWKDTLRLSRTVKHFCKGLGIYHVYKLWNQFAADKDGQMERAGVFLHMCNMHDEVIAYLLHLQPVAPAFLRVVFCLGAWAEPWAEALPRDWN